MKNEFLGLSLLAFFLIFSACRNNKSIQKIEDLEQMMIDSSQSPARNNIMKELAEAYLDYVMENPSADDAVDKQLKAAQNYGSIGDFGNAITLLDAFY